MTNEQKYNVLLKELAVLISDKDTSLTLLEYELQTLKVKLDNAEARIKELLEEGENNE